MKHIHAELIQKWISDTSQPVWGFYLQDRTWFRIDKPQWNDSMNYAVGYSKPSGWPRSVEVEPVCTIGGLSFPRPESQEPLLRTDYFIPDVIIPGLFRRENWTGHLFDKDLLKLGFVHLSSISAIEHSKAMLAAHTTAIQKTT